MTINRVQTQRPSSTGVRPTGRKPGEFYVNLADMQFGVINAAGTAQDLGAVRFFSTSANYVANDFVIQAGALYVANGAVTAGAFNPAQWTALGGAGVAFLPLTGGTMTGPLVLAADPSANLQSATKQYVDAHAAGVNRLINGDMRIDQRNNGVSGTAVNTYTVDRWQYSATQTGKGTWGRTGSGVPGFPYCFGFTSSSAYASVAADNFVFWQPIEADMVSDFAWGGASAQPVTLSFWVLSSLTGTFSGSLKNFAGTRAYPFTYSIPVAATWTRIVVTIPGDTAGTWVMSGNAASIVVGFDLGCGLTARGPANAWASVNYNGATGAVSVVGTNAATFYVTGVKLEVGSVATSYNQQSLAKSMTDCQRYYQRWTDTIGGGLVAIQGYASAASGVVWNTMAISPMRAAPTAAAGGSIFQSNLGFVTFYPGPTTLGINVSAIVAGQVVWRTNNGAYLALDAEL